jgi:hypothetical protein
MERDILVSDDLYRAIAETGGKLRFVNEKGEVLGRFEPELTVEELAEIRRRLASNESRYTTQEVLSRLRSKASP